MVSGVRTTRSRAERVHAQPPVPTPPSRLSPSRWHVRARRVMAAPHENGATPLIDPPDAVWALARGTLVRGVSASANSIMQIAYPGPLWPAGPPHCLCGLDRPRHRAVIEPASGPDLLVNFDMVPIGVIKMKTPNPPAGQVMGGVDRLDAFLLQGGVRSIHIVHRDNQTLAGLMNRLHGLCGFANAAAMSARGNNAICEPPVLKLI